MQRKYTEENVDGGLRIEVNKESVSRRKLERNRQLSITFYETVIHVNP